MGRRGPLKRRFRTSTKRNSPSRSPSTVRALLCGSAPAMASHKASLPTLMRWLERRLGIGRHHRRSGRTNTDGLDEIALAPGPFGRIRGRADVWELPADWRDLLSLTQQVERMG